MAKREGNRQASAKQEDPTGTWVRGMWPAGIDQGLQVRQGDE